MNKRLVLSILSTVWLIVSTAVSAQPAWSIVEDKSPTDNSPQISAGFFFFLKINYLSDGGVLRRTDRGLGPQERLYWQCSVHRPLGQTEAQWLRWRITKGIACASYLLTANEGQKSYRT